jgi:hypothetical protein
MMGKTVRAFKQMGKGGLACPLIDPSACRYNGMSRLSVS